MPFPFAAVGAAIASAVGSAVAGGAAAAAAAGAAVAGAATAADAAVAAASATTLIVGGVSIAAGGVLAAAAISAHNDEKRRKARETAERAASRERERQLVEAKKEHDKKLRDLIDRYGADNIPREKAEEYWGKSAEILGALEGNSAGLRKQGQSVSSDAEAAEAELKAEFAAAGVKE